MRLPERLSKVCQFVCITAVLALVAGSPAPLRAMECTRTSASIATGTRWETTFHVIDSGAPGPTVMILGGVHGNEPAGAYAAEQIRNWPITRGKLVVVPCVNRPGRAANTRFLPDAERDERDLNRNFPSRENRQSRSELAKAVWELTLEMEPDWVLDLHEGYEFNISHKPPEGKKKSVGTSIIYVSDDELDPLVERMIESVNAGIENADRKFVALGGGPVDGSWVRACVRELGAKGMILETTFKDQRLPLRTLQHRVLVNEALMSIGLIESSQVHVVIDRDASSIGVALFDGPGATAGGIERLSAAIASQADMQVCVLGPQDYTEQVLKQFDVVLFPGGSGSRQGNALGIEGREAVRAFIADGGGCVGVCAGAYLCSAYYSWSLKVIDTKVFTGSRDIEGVGKKQMWYRGGPADVEMELTETGTELFAQMPKKSQVRYQNGPIVTPMNDPLLPDYEVLAYFRSENGLYPPQVGTMVDTPAIVTAPFGAGQVVSISPHPEATEGLEPMIAVSIRHSIAAQIMDESR